MQRVSFARHRTIHRPLFTYLQTFKTPVAHVYLDVLYCRCLTRVSSHATHTLKIAHFVYAAYLPFALVASHHNWRESDDHEHEAQAPRPRRAPVRAYSQSNIIQCTLAYATLTNTRFVPLDCSGLGLIVESDFYTTPAGRQHFANQLQSIRVSWLCLVDVHSLPIDPCKQLLTCPSSCGSSLAVLRARNGLH